MSLVGNADNLALAKGSPAAPSLTLLRSFKTAPQLAKVHKFFKAWLKLDLATLVVLAALSNHTSYLTRVYSSLTSWVSKFFIASVSIPGNDLLNSEVLNWLAANVLERQRTRKLTAKSYNSAPRVYRYTSVGTIDLIMGRETSTTCLLSELHIFFFNRNLFMVRRDAEYIKTKNAVSNEKSKAPTGEETLVVMCPGRSVEPIRK
jgi:chaperone BCS1